MDYLHASRRLPPGAFGNNICLEVPTLNRPPATASRLAFLFSNELAAGFWEEKVVEIHQEHTEPEAFTSSLHPSPWLDE
jgi:hypothetical protein